MYLALFDFLKGEYQTGWHLALGWVLIFFGEKSCLMLKRQRKKPKRNQQLLTINKYIYKMHSVFTPYAIIKKKTRYEPFNIETFNIETFYFNQLFL